MPYLAWRAIRVVLWTAFCTVAALYLWHKAREPLNAEATRLELSARSGRLGTVNLCVCMFSTPRPDGSPGSGILLIGHGAGSWDITLPDLVLVEPGPGDQPPGTGPRASTSTMPLTEGELARLMTGSQWPSRDAELNADMDELWDLVRSSRSGVLSTRVRRFSIVQAEPWRRPVWARSGIGVVWLVLIWTAGAVLVWQIGSESPSDRDIAEAIAAERSRQKAVAGKVLPNDTPRPMTGRYLRSGAQAHGAGTRAALDDRTPVPNGDSVDRVLRELVRAESLKLAGSVAKLAIGLPLCLLGPLFVAVLIEPLLMRWGGGLFPSFGTIFLILTAVLLPLLLWLERRTKGEYFADVIREESRTVAGSRDDEFQRRDTGLACAFFTEIALLGPRLVWAFIDRLRGRPRGDRSTRLVAAQVACELVARGEGVPLSALVRPDRPLSQVAAAVEHLLACGWVGRSVQHDRAWLASRVAARLTGVLGQGAHAPAISGGLGG
jgi:hypothetical protein